MVSHFFLCIFYLFTKIAKIIIKHDHSVLLPWQPKITFVSKSMVTHDYMVTHY